MDRAARGHAPGFLLHHNPGVHFHCGTALYEYIGAQCWIDDPERRGWSLAQQDLNEKDIAAPGRHGMKEDIVKLDTPGRILDYAIQKEEEAAEFYKDLAAKMARPAMKDVFIGFSQEEMGHKAKLMAVRDGHKLVLSQKKITDLKIGDHLVEPEPVKGEMTYQDALIIAMKAEKAAYTLYTSLAGATDNADLQKLFHMLAQEEAKHKLRFEVEYDEVVLSEN
jgi:rubrerythrin